MLKEQPALEKCKYCGQTHRPENDEGNPYTEPSCVDDDDE